MRTPGPEHRRSHRGLLAPLGVLLVLSGIGVIVLAAITTLLAAPPGVFLVGRGIRLVIVSEFLSEFHDEADVDYGSGGLNLSVRKGTGDDEDASSSRPSSRCRRPARRTAGGCRLAQTLSRRWNG